ncbi:MAG: TIGR00304 family membrane protein [Candidatus Thorarchaeota archaeon]
MIQTPSMPQLLGFLILGLGIVLIVAGCLVRQRETSGESTRSESKGMILIGPIPIVWGFGRRGWFVAAAVGVFLVLIWIIGLL